MRVEKSLKRFWPYLRSPVSAIHAHVQHYIGNVFLFLYGEHFLTLGATFFLWRDFFLLARLFFEGATFFSLVRLFLTGTTFFSPARLFFAGATSLALICRPLLNFIAGKLRTRVLVSKMADSVDSADSDLKKVSSM